MKRGLCILLCVLGLMTINQTLWASDVQVSGTATAKDVFQSNVANNARDGNVDSRWEGDSAMPQWIYQDLGSRVIVHGYGFYPQGLDQSHLYTWQFQGSNDAATWTTLDSVSGYTGMDMTTHTFHNFWFSNDTAYRYYRVRITDTRSHQWAAIYEMRMYAGAEIRVRGNGTSIADGDTTPAAADDTHFGSVLLGGTPVSHTFTVDNIGSGTLNLNGSPRVQISGTHASDFTVTAQPAATVAASGSTTFTVQFDPQGAGDRTATISISNDDPNENPFNFTIQGVGIQEPEMGVSGNGVDIADGDTSPSSADDTNFGDVEILSSVGYRTFVIENTGTGGLTLTGSPYVNIIGSADFTVSTQPPATIAAGGTASFTIAFDPSATGTISAEVSIANDDADEDPYNFTIQGTGTEAPEIDLTGNSQPIANHDFTPEAGNDTFYGNLNLTASSVNHTFTIRNAGSLDLDLTGSPRAQVTGLHPSDFFVTAQPSTGSLVSLSGVTFSVAFRPANGGNREAVIVIPNTDPNEAPYRFKVSGVGSASLGQAVLYLADTFTGSAFQRVRLADLDRDGDLEAVVARNGANDVYLVDGVSITDSGQTLGTSDSRDVALGDMDGDGHIDAVFANDGANVLYANNGFGTFSVDTTFGTEQSYGVDLGDLDGNGFLDVFLANDGANRVYFNDGTSLTDTLQSLGTAASLAVKLGDVDGDGDLDAFVVNNGANTVWLNDGTGTFTDSGQTLGTATSFDVALVDVDGDGDLDAFVGNNGPNKVWLNNGSGVFSDSGQSLGTADTRGVAAGDLLANGSMDVYCANQAADTVWINNGSGTFTNSGQSIGSEAGFGAALGDFDGNGSIDAFTAASTGSSMYLNQAPEMDVKGNSTSIADGDASPSTADHTDFGTLNTSGATLTRTFIIENSGDFQLSLTGPSPYVSITGTHAADFAVTAMPATPIGAGSSTTFQITFDPSAAGLRSAEVSIANNDPDENPYTFAIQGTGASAPDATTNAATGVDQSAATLNGLVNANNDSTTVAFQYGLTAAYGTTITAAESPVTGLTDTAVSAAVSGLTSNQTYHYRVTATNAVGTSNGSDMTLVTGGPAISVDDVTLAEGDTGSTSFVFTLTLSNPSATTVTVNVGTADNTALAGSDYTAVSDTVTFNPGVVSQTVTVNVTGETTREGDETFYLNLSSASNATISDSQGVGTIQNDDPVPSISINDVLVTEGDSGTVSADFTVSLSNPSDQTITVDYSTADLTATAGVDYTAVPTTTLTFNPGDTSKPLSVSVIGDTRHEPDETVLVNLTNPSGATIADGIGMCTISNDDPPPTLSVIDGTITETDSGTATLHFTVSMSKTSDSTITVNYATADDTATAGDDYTAVSTSTLTFTPGQTVRTVDVSIIGDLVDEPDETFYVNLSNPVNATITDGEGIGTILDNDAPPSLSINDAAVAEGDSGSTNLTFTVSLSSVSGKSITVDYATSDGTASSGDDYTATSNTLTIAPGTTTGTINVPILGDTVYEPDETITVTLSNPTNVTMLDGSASGTITNDDPEPTVSVDDAERVEGDGGLPGYMTVTLTLSNPSWETVSVNVDFTDGTAVNGVDYIAGSGITSFSSGTTTAQLAVQIIGDRDIEPDETFTCTLSNPVNATIGDGIGIGTITNDDWNVTVSGTVMDGSSPLEGVTITFSHDGHVETTAADGSYSYSFLNNTTTTVTPSHPTYSFSPTGATFSNIQIDRTADFAATLITYEITATHTTGGAISPSGTVTVIHGEDQGFRILPDDGYRIVDLIVDGSSLGSLDYYRFRNVTGPHDLHAVFDVDTPPVIDSLTADPIAGNAVLNVNIVGLAHDPDGGTIAGYSWEITGRRNDMTVTREGTLVYRFVLPGEYQVTLTVMDDEGTVSAPASLEIHVAESAPLTIPVPTRFDFNRVRAKVDLNVAVRVVNIFDEEALVQMETLDKDGAVLQTHDVQIAPFGSTTLETDWIHDPETASVRATADRYVVVVSSISGDTAAMTAYLNTDFRSILTAPHIAEETDYWDTLTYLSNSRPDLLDAVVAGTITSLTPAPSQIVDLESLMEAEPDELTAWGSLRAHAADPFSSPSTMSGFEMFIRNGGDGAAVELQRQVSHVLYVPHIPEERDIFWTGFAFVNPGDADADCLFHWFSDSGELLGISEVMIPAHTKLKGLMDDLFPEFSDTAHWMLVGSEVPVMGIEIFGTHDAGICGMALPGSAHSNGLLPDLAYEAGKWSGLVITNVTKGTVDVTLELVGADGIVKETRMESLAGFSRFKAVVSDYFTDSAVMDGDYIRYTATGPVVGLQISGNDDRTVMSALTAAQ